MTQLTTTVFRVVNIGSRRYALGIHPSTRETLLSIRPIGRRTAYVAPLSALHIQAALAFGRAEQSAKREARKNGVPWQSARRKFLASIVPPTIKRKKKKGGAS